MKVQEESPEILEKQDIREFLNLKYLVLLTSMIWKLTKTGQNRKLEFDGKVLISPKIESQKTIMLCIFKRQVYVGFNSACLKNDTKMATFECVRTGQGWKNLKINWKSTVNSEFVFNPLGYFCILRSFEFFEKKFNFMSEIEYFISY